MASKDLSGSSEQGSLSSISTRPSSLVQRLSSFLASIPIHRAMSQRTQTAPNSENTPPGRWMRIPFRRENSTSSLPQNLRVPAVDICPNDPNVYYSFPPFEDEQCNCHSVFCGLCRNDRRRSSTADWPSRATETIRRCSLSRPCTPSRAGQPCAHLAMDRRAISNVARRNNSSRFAEMMDDPPLNVRISSSPQRVDAGRRRISVPGSAGFSRPPTRRGPVPDNQRGPAFESLLQRPYSPQSNQRKTPSPKLHRFLGNEAHPYVHRHEAESFLSTAGPSVVSGLSVPTNRGSYPDTRRGSNASQFYADTVYYPPRSPSPRPASSTPSVHGNTRPAQPNRPPPTSSTVRAAHTSLPRISSPLVSVSNIENFHASGRVTVDRNGRPVSFDVELATTDVYRIHGERRSRGDNSQTHHREAPANDNSGSSADTGNSSATEMLAQTPSTIGGRRLELRGGAPGAPRLRGGGGSGSESRLSVSTIGKRLRDIFWTCGGNCNVPGPYDDLPPPRLRLNYTNPLAGGHARAAVPALRGGSVIPMNQQNTLRLRGGGKSEETKSIVNFDDDDARIPPLLWFLVGGTGGPMTVGQWRKQKPKKRVGGVLGIAIYGRKAGMPYEDKTCPPKTIEEPTSPKESKELKEEGSGEHSLPDVKAVHGVTVQAPEVGQSSNVEAEEVGLKDGTMMSPTKDAGCAAAADSRAAAGEETKSAGGTSAGATTEKEESCGKDDATTGEASEGNEKVSRTGGDSGEDKEGDATPGKQDGKLPTPEEPTPEEPIPEKPTLEKPTLEKPTLEKPTLEKPTPKERTPPPPSSDSPASENTTGTGSPPDAAASKKTTSNDSAPNEAKPDIATPNDAARNDLAQNDATPPDPAQQDRTGNERSEDENPSTKQKEEAEHDTNAAPEQNDGADKNNNAAPSHSEDPQSPASQKPATERANPSESQRGKVKRENGAAQQRRKRCKRERRTAKEGTASPSSSSGGGAGNDDASGGTATDADAK